MKHLGACDYSVKAFVLWTAQPRSRLPLCNHCRVFPRTPASSASECAVPDPRIYTGPRVQAKTANVQTHAEHTRAGGLVCFLSHRQLRSFSPSHTQISHLWDSADRLGDHSGCEKAPGRSAESAVETFYRMTRSRDHCYDIYFVNVKCSRVPQFGQHVRSRTEGRTVPLDKLPF